MSLVFYWPISFKSPTPFSGHTECLMVPKKKKKTRESSRERLLNEMERRDACVSIPAHVCYGIGLPSCDASAACMFCVTFHRMSCMLEWLPCGFFFSFTCVCVCVCVCLGVLNLCFALKDRERGMGSQSVPLQINSLIPDPSFLQNTHYLQRLSPPTASSSSSVPSLITPPSFSLIASVYSPRLSVNQATCMGSCVFVWESDESVTAEAAFRSTPVLSAHSLAFRKLLSSERGIVSEIVRGQSGTEATGWEKASTGLGPLWEKGPHFPLHSERNEWIWMGEANIVACPISGATSRFLSILREAKSECFQWGRGGGRMRTCEGTNNTPSRPLGTPRIPSRARTGSDEEKRNDSINGWNRYRGNTGWKCWCWRMKKKRKPSGALLALPHVSLF